MHENCLYIFGGKDDENAKLNDLWKFDMETLTWTELVAVNGGGSSSANHLGVSEHQTNRVPMPRSGHSAVLYDGYICIFGGIFEVTKELNDLQLQLRILPRLLIHLRL